MYFLEIGIEPRKDRKILRITRNGHHDDLVARIFELGRECFVCVHDRNGESDEGRRDVQVFKGAGHRILAADCGNAHLMLRAQRAEKSRKGLAPLLRLRT